MSVALNTKHLSSFISEEEYAAIYPQVEAAHKQLEAKNGPGSDFLGWMTLPRDYDKEEFARIKAAAAKIREDSDVLVVAGIGGSYLGARAVVEAVKGMYHNELEDGLKIYFCGNSISPTYLNNIISLCKGKRFSINVISKSGTTTETSLAFRVLRELLEKEMGVEEANKRIYATTDRAKGTLKQLADAQGWPTFVVPDDVGGRYSVLSAVGLLPIAAAGIDIDALMQGAADAMERFSVLSPDNDAYKYAAIRNIEFVKYHVFPDGYMMRVSPESSREQIRVSKKAVKKGISFYKVGCDFIKQYKKNPNITNVRVIFVTKDVDFKALHATAKKIEDVTKTMNTILEGMPEDLDCASCSFKPVCDEVEGLKELHFGKAAKKEHHA